MDKPAKGQRLCSYSKEQETKKMWVKLVSGVPGKKKRLWCVCGNIVPIMFQVVLVQLRWSNKGHSEKIKSKTWGGGIKKNTVVNL